MPSKRPPSIMGDDERAEIGRAERRTPARGIPVEIDPEATPPPREPPDIRAMHGFDELPDSYRRPLLALHAVQREHDLAMTRLWAARNFAEDFRALSDLVGEIDKRTAQLPDLTKAVNDQAGQLHRVHGWISARREIDSRLSTALEGFTQRLGQHDAVLAAFTEKYGALSIQVEQQRALAREGNLEKTEERKELEHRVRDLEDTKNAGRGALWAFGVLAAILSFVAGWFGAHVGGSGQK